MALLPNMFVLLLLGFPLDLCRGASISAGCIANERNVLFNIKKNLEDQQNRLASWKDEDCCSWEGVFCDNVTGHVLKLDLRNPHHFFDPYVDAASNKNDVHPHNEWSLRGQLSPSLLGLKHINYLDLSMNYFDGSIPKFLGSLHNLRYLNLSLAGFHGLIPRQLGNLSRLNYLDLTFDNEAIIDDSRWISHLTLLKHLTMERTHFENFQNWMEALNKLPNIVEIRIRYCNIGDFPLSLPFVNFTKLSYLDLFYNLIDLKAIPLWLFSIKNLNHIDLSKNNFKSIPDALKNLTSLEYLDFSANDFRGDLPQALKSLCKMHTLKFAWANIDRRMHEFKEIFLGCLKDSIENLDLSENEIDGYLPNWLGELHKLKTLDLSNNLLFGSIPKSLERLSALQELILSNNKLNGTISESIGQLSKLVRLCFDGNFFRGVISEVHFVSLEKLKELNIQSSNLILNVSRAWIPPFKLNIIQMGSCRIGPEFPQWLQTQVNLTSLDLSNSGIVGLLPNWFQDVFAIHGIRIFLDLSKNKITGSLPHLSKLCFSYFNLRSNLFEGPLPYVNAFGIDVSNNSFSGSIPSIFGKQASDYIVLSTNEFSGKIPSSMCFSSAIQIDISSNLLTGELPNCWNQNMYGFLSLLDFSRNNLSGNIPHTLGTFGNLELLRLDHNNLCGSIPMTLQNCTSLGILDLGMNKLEGIIPTWIGENLTNLEVLILSSNNFIGNVPSNLSNLKYLHILYLDDNKLSGRIPSSFGNFTLMVDIYKGQLSYMYMGASNNALLLTIKGHDLNFYILPNHMTAIDLSCNNLSHQIPKELVNLKGLNFLNLSRNHLVGSIPDEIDLMSSLECLDLSRNELSGNIPLSMSNMTMLDFLNLSYNNLSGRIPLGSQLQTFTNESYIGNPKLCGFPLTQPCDSDQTTNVEVSEDEVTISDCWYMSIAPGFALGFWIVLGTFFLKKKWKDAYFRYVDSVYDAIYVAIKVSINRFKRNIGNEAALG